MLSSPDHEQSEVRRILPFVNDSEARKVTMIIMSVSEDLGFRALRAKKVFEEYLNEARSLVLDNEKPIPDFYDRTTNVYKVIERARDAILLE